MKRKVALAFVLLACLAVIWAAAESSRSIELRVDRVRLLDNPQGGNRSVEVRIVNESRMPIRIIGGSGHATEFAVTDGSGAFLAGRTSQRKDLLKVPAGNSFLVEFLDTGMPSSAVLHLTVRDWAGGAAPISKSLNLRTLLEGRTGEDESESEPNES
ncbi:hypothetical protein [Candidatus Laterigemmans baculatus]|uniref:hypothetical protein n=1 Tax=Candidatus Laterigemmans baculatus TaxID=2770505 RepID=UPI0013DAE995|nr:hypothetical protein [Candidatus Laterigemmans baculatus]